MKLKQLIKLITDISGVSLTGAVMSAGALGGLALMSLKLIDRQTKSSRHVEQKFEITNMVKEMRALLSSKDACTVNFGNDFVPGGQGMTVPGEYEVENLFKVVLTPTRSRGTAKYKKGGLYGFRTLEIENMILGRPSLENPARNPPAFEKINGLDDLVIVPLFINFRKTGKTMGGTVIRRHINITARLNDSDSSIKWCFATSSTAEGFWKATTAPEGIYYGDTDAGVFNGYVGIGTDTPIAQLDVNGPLKIGKDTTPCNSTTKGLMKYDPSAPADPKVLYYCDGDDWRDINVFGKECPLPSDPSKKYLKGFDNEGTPICVAPSLSKGVCYNTACDDSPSCPGNDEAMVSVDICSDPPYAGTNNPHLKATCCTLKVQ